MARRFDSRMLRSEADASSGGVWQKAIGADYFRRPPSLAAIEQKGGAELNYKIELPQREVWTEEIDLLGFDED